MADDQSKPKLHVDSDWKAEAQREKERLAQKEQARSSRTGAGAGAGGGGAASGGAAGGQANRAGQAAGSAPTPDAAPGKEADHAAHELPEPSFRALVGMLGSQAVMGLGAMADPQTNRIILDLEGARFAIDLLEVLEQKTKGNLTDEESKELRQILAELRSRFVQISQFVARQMAAQQAAAANVPPMAGTAAGGPMPPLRASGQ